MDPEEDPPAQEDYLDFELEIGTGSGRVYPVAVVRSAAGEAREMMQFPYDDLALENQLLMLQNALLRSGGKPRHILLPEEQSVQDFGLALFKILFVGEIGNCYAVSQREAEQQDKGLRVKLRILSPEMATIPWEFLYDPGRAEYICLSRNTPVVRYLELPQPPQPLPVTLPLRILGMIATPTNLPLLDVQREQQRMEKALEALQQRGLVQLTWLAGQTWRDVQQAMREGPWHIFHFIGHGSFDPLADEGLVAFTDEQGQADLFRATQLARLLSDHRSLRLVVLNACESAKSGRHDVFSSAAANLVRHGIPAVLAMQYTITDAAAIVFSRAFYEALAAGMPIDAAVSEARKAVSFEVENTLEWGIPVLFMRSPDGVLFTVSQGPTLAVRQPPLPVVPSYEVVTGKPAPKAPHISRRAVLIGVAGAVVAIAALGTSIFLTTHQQSPLTTPTPRATTVPLHHLFTYRGHSAAVAQIAWSPDGQRIASSSSDKTVQVWSPNEVSNMFTYRGHASATRAVAWLQDGKRIASGSEDKTVQVWNANDGSNVFTYRGHTDKVWSVAWSPDGKRIASCSDDKTVQVWNANDGSNVFTYRGHSQGVYAVAWSPDGKRIASGSLDTTVQVWNANDGSNVFTYKGHSNAARSVAWSPDGQRIVSGSWDATVQVWNANDGSKPFIYREHTDQVKTVAWSPDGQWIASGSADKTARVWNASNGREVFTYLGHTDTVSSVAWSPDGQRIASGSWDKTTQVWNVV